MPQLYCGQPTCLEYSTPFSFTALLEHWEEEHHKMANTYVPYTGRCPLDDLKLATHPKCECGQLVGPEHKLNKAPCPTCAGRIKRAIFTGEEKEAK